MTDAVHFDTWTLPLVGGLVNFVSSLTPGSLVFVKGTGRIARLVSSDSKSATLAGDATTDGVSVKLATRKLIPVFGRLGRPALLLCAETDQFRSLCRTQLQPDDSVLEVGCSFGLATVEIAGAGARAVMAVDIACDAIESAVARCVQTQGHSHNIRFVCMDVLRYPAKLVELAAQQQVNVLFVDLGGNRDAGTVAQFLLQMLESLRPTLALVVVKCRELQRRAVDHQGSSAVKEDAAGHVPLPLPSFFWAEARAAAEAHRVATHAAEGEQNANLAPGETRVCFDFLNLGRCSRARNCSFRHLLPESAEAQVDAAMRGVEVHRTVAGLEGTSSETEVQVIGSAPALPSVEHQLMDAIDQEGHRKGSAPTQ